MCAAAAAGEWFARGLTGQIGGGFSLESEHDLGLMVSDFLENGGSSGPDSRCSSDSESGGSDLRCLADKISFCKHSVAQYELDLLSLVHSLMLSIKETDLYLVKAGLCNSSCIRFSLVKLLRLAGYDAAVCASRWQGGGTGKLPGGGYEYIDVIHSHNGGSIERLIIDIDFRKHFEIARAVASYDKILKSLPVVYLGSINTLEEYLQVMVEAAKSSLKQHSMPLPPWRSLSYLQSKWYSPYQRHFSPDEQDFSNTNSYDHKQCNENLKRLQSWLRSEIDEERLLKPKNDNNNWRVKRERRRLSFLRGL
ncbi:hypothetical protein M5689_001900 [Euphorbia peplus]|nr:hypothetical protein M5689_001900 [Euphorbia peplus]